MSIELAINKYKDNQINHIESLIVELISLLENHYHSTILELLNEFDNIENDYIIQIIDAQQLLVSSPKVSVYVKELLNDSKFIEDNPNILLSLAKVFFHADNISLNNNEIIISKKVIVPSVEIDVPEIDEDKVLYQILQKIKYDRLTEQNIKKLHELDLYKKYKPLYRLIMTAIEQKVIIQKLNEDELKMGSERLKKLLAID